MMDPQDHCPRDNAHSTESAGKELPDPPIAHAGGAANRDPADAAPPHPEARGLPTIHDAPHSVVILDVDGVIFRSQFCLELSRAAGFRTYVAVLLDGFRFNRGRLSLERLLVDGYRRLAGLPAESLQTVFARMSRTKNSKEAIAELKKHGYLVLLISSGVPDDLVKHLARDLGADQGEGIEVHQTDGVLSGEISGVLTKADGKVSFVRQWLHQRGLNWSHAVVVGDDDSNLGLMNRTSVSVGIHATMNVRRKADYLAKRDDLLSAVPFILEPHVLPPKTDPRVELTRRLVHMTAFGWPFVAHHVPTVAVGLLTVAAVLYAFSEFFRLNGLVFPAFGNVTNLVLRESEQRRLATAPLTLTAGVLASLAFPYPIPYVAIGIAAFGDTVAGLVGQFLGRCKLFYSPAKTVEGMTASFVVSLAICLFFHVPLLLGILIAAVASFVESLPLEDWDNLLVPVSTAFLCLAVL